MSYKKNKEQYNKYITLLAGLFIVLFAFQIRIMVVTNSIVINPIRADARDYFFYAYNLKKYNIYSRSDSGFKNNNLPKPDALRSPGFPYFASLFFDDLLTDSALKKIIFINVILSILTVLTIFLISSFMMPSPYAVITGILTAISPHLVNTNIYFLSETLFTFLICIFILFYYLACKYKKNILWLSVGFILGAAMLVRPFIQYFIILILFLVYFTPLVTNKIKVTLFILAGFFLLVAPWSLRNYYHFGYISDDTLVINTLVHGMYPDFKYQGKPESFGSPYRFDPNIKESSKSVYTALEEIKRRFLEKPVEHLKWYIIGKPIYLWSWNIVQGQGDVFIYPVQQSPYFDNRLLQTTYYLSKFSHIWCILLAAIASILIWFKVPTLINSMQDSSICTIKLISLLLIYTTVLHMVGTPLPRYSIPLRPEVYLMSCLFIYWIIVMFFNKRRMA